MASAADLDGWHVLTIWRGLLTDHIENVVQLVGVCIIHPLENVDEDQNLDPLLQKCFVHSGPIFSITAKISASIIIYLVITRKGFLDQVVPDNRALLEDLEDRADVGLGQAKSGCGIQERQQLLNKVRARKNLLPCVEVSW